MPSIDEQIKSLERTKAKIKLYQELIEFSESLKEAKTHKSLVDEVKTEFKGLLDPIISGLETNGKVKLEANGIVGFEADSGPFTEEEVTKLKLLISRLDSKKRTKSNRNNKKSTSPPSGRMDPLSFAQRYRHLDGKKVTFSSKDGDVRGVVVGMLTPNLIIKTDTGYEVSISPERLKEALDGKDPGN